MHHRQTEPPTVRSGIGFGLASYAILQDLRHAVRLFRHNPVFTIVAIITLALGIGANTAMFSAMNAVLLRYLPVKDPERVVYLRVTGLPGSAPGFNGQTGDINNSFSGQTFERFREQKPPSLSALMAYVPLSYTGEVAVRRGALPETAKVMMVSGEFFSGLGVGAFQGRTLEPDDETNHSALAVLSHGYWTRRFARDPSLLGESIHIKGLPFTIVGIAAPGFDGVVPGSRTDLWIPLQTRPELGPWGQSVEGPSFVYDSPGWWFLMMLGRLAPGVSREQAAAQLNPLFQRTVYGDAEPKTDEEVPQLYFESTRGAQNLSEAASHPLALLMAMVILVLVIACGNVGMLLTARNATRRREFSLRLALGAGRLHLLRQLLTENLLLVLAGGLLGWTFASWATQLLTSWSNFETGLRPDGTALAFTFAICLTVSIAFGLIPLRTAARVPASQVLRVSGATANKERRGFWGGRWVVALQLALCLALLVGAGLLVRSLLKLEGVDLGFKTDNLFVFGVNPERSSDGETKRFYRSLLEELRALPGVESVTLMENRIGSGWSNNTSVYVDGAPAKDSKGNSVLRWNIVGPEYFATLGVPLLKGREMTDSDTLESPRVAVVNRTFAETFLSERDPLGHSISLGGPSERPFSIIGVAADSKYTTVRENPRPMAYLSYAQLTGTKILHVELRARREPASLFPEIRGVVSRLDPELPLIQPTSQRAQFEQTYSDSRMFARLALFFGGLAALLVAVGLYGILAYRVARRTVEIGVRMALGARRGQVLWMILRESLVVCLVGGLVGLPLALLGARALQAQLFGIGAYDPVTFGVALAGLSLVALVASFIPARRASTIDPLRAIRYE